MAAKVGPKGQVVIAKEIRDKLGVQPGWRAFQILIDDHVEIYFIPPEHSESLAGLFAPYIQTSVPVGEAWEQARDRAWEEAVKAKEERIREQYRTNTGPDERR